MTAVPTSITISPAWQQKGELLMQGLVEEVRALWSTFSEIEAQPVPGGQLEIGNLNLILNGLRRALATIRTLDVAVFMESDKNAYSAVRQNDPQAVAVRGLVGPRNNAVHHPEVVDPDISRAVGPLDNGRFLIYPRWKVRDASLDSVFTVEDSRGNKQFKKTYADAYDRALSGRALLDPILDAFAFFERLAPGLAQYDDDGQLVGLPLEPLPEGLGYKRLAPSWPPELIPGARRAIHQQDETVASKPVTGSEIFLHIETEFFCNDHPKCFSKTDAHSFQRDVEWE